MSKKEAAFLEYLLNKYPTLRLTVVYVQFESGLRPHILVPQAFANEIYAVGQAWNDGYHSSSKISSEEYTKNIQEAIIETYSAGYNEGFAEGNEQGFSLGSNTEWAESILPSNAYDVEVFAVKPSNDFESGQQAFVGFKFDLDGVPQFHYVQIQFAVPNLQIKQKINEKTTNCYGDCGAKSISQSISKKAN